MEDVKILELSLKKLSEAFNELVSECLDDDGKPKKPTVQSLMKARGYLPPYCTKSFNYNP